MPPVRETRYLGRPEGRIGYDVAGDGSLVVLVPGMGDLRAGYHFLAPWIARALHAQVVMVAEAGHYPQSQQADITTAAVLRFLESVNGRG